MTTLATKLLLFEIERKQMAEPALTLEMVQSHGVELAGMPLAAPCPLLLGLLAAGAEAASALLTQGHAPHGESCSGLMLRQWGVGHGLLNVVTEDWMWLPG